MRSQFPVTTPTQAWRMSVGHAYSGNALDVGGAEQETLHRSKLVQSLLLGHLTG